MAEFTRDEIVTMAQAVQEFRDEYSGPHLDANRELAERIRSVLREGGLRDDTFELRLRSLSHGGEER